MRFIYLVKALQFIAIVMVIGLYLGQSKLCGKIDVLSNPTRGNVSNTTAISTVKQHSNPIQLRIVYKSATDNKDREPEEHWSQRLRETMGNKIFGHSVQKRDVSQFDGEPGGHETEATTTVSMEADTIVDHHTIDTSTLTPEIASSVEPNESKPDKMKRFEWRVDGCIPLSAADFFDSPPTLAGNIASQLFWAMILVACHSFILLFQSYLVYTSHLPPALFGDFVRILIGMLLWYISLANLVFVHYRWEYDWSRVNLMTIPEFPKNWIYIEVISVLVLLSCPLEICCRRLVYSNMRVVPEVSTRNNVKNTRPTSN